MGDWSFAGGMKANPELYAKYEVLERLGEGTYGEVFKGKRRVDGLVVALKETRDAQCATREAEALVALNHSNVVKLVEYFVQGPNLILVLEFLPTDLYRELEGRDGRVPEAEVKGWMLQILRGVAACHQASILHRDLKPSNLLVGADGNVKVADFGQARVIRLQSDDLLGIDDITFVKDDVKTTHKIEKEETDTWICGAAVAKSNVKESMETRRVMTDSGEGVKKSAISSVDHVAGQCFCVMNDEEFQESLEDRSGSRNTVGCRSLNCSMVKRDGLIVARSNHFVEIEQKMEAVKSARDEELKRREWVLAEKNLGSSEQEKDGDFFCKLRSFLKRRGRKPQKHFRWGRDKSDTERSQIIMEEEGGRLDYLDQEIDTAVLQDHVHAFISGQRPSPSSIVTAARGKTGTWTNSTLSKEVDSGKTDVEHMDDVGLRPLMGNESTEEEIVFRGLQGPGSCVLEKNSKRSTCDLEESVHAYVYHPPVENLFDGTYTSQIFGDSGRMIMNSNNHSHGGRDDTGSESKRRKAYELEKCVEQIMSTDHGLEVGLEAGDIDSKVNQDAIVDMETDARISELEAVRNRILYGKHRRTDSQKDESPSLQSGNSVDYTGHFEASKKPPTVVTDFLPSLRKDEMLKTNEVAVEAEETEKAVRVLGLERVYNGTEGCLREVECAQEGSAACGPEKEGTIRFWDGDRQRWESPYASDEDRGIEDPFNSKWFAGGSGHSRTAANGLFFDDGLCPVDQVPGYYAFGDTEAEDSDQEEGDLACQTRWYGPPDVRDSYVKGKLEVHEESSQNENVDEYSGEAFEQLNDQRLYETEAHSQQEETESTYSDESGNKGSDLSPFVGTRWYKAPELLYGATKYGTGLDMWAAGCIFAELLSGKPLFPGITDIDQLSRIVRVLGAPNDSIWPGVSVLPDFDKISFSDQRGLLSFRNLIPQASTSALKFLEKFLVYDPERRISAEAALKDVYFLEDPLPVLTQDLKMPSFRRDSSASEDWGEWRDPGSPFSDFEILDSAL